MRLPIQAQAVGYVSMARVTDGGIAPSFCTPCVLGKQICGLPFSPRVEDCGGGDPDPTCINVGPCIPFINRQLRCCLSTGCSLQPC
jgi:hypothetical protein